MTLTEWKERGTKLLGLFRLNTSPVAVRLLGGGERLPKGAVRPLRDYGLSIAVCQAMGMARRLGLTVAMTPEDSECPTGTLLFGWAKMGSGE